MLEGRMKQKQGSFIMRHGQNRKKIDSYSFQGRGRLRIVGEDLFRRITEKKVSSRSSRNPPVGGNKRKKKESALLGRGPERKKSDRTKKAAGDEKEEEKRLPGAGGKA